MRRRRRDSLKRGLQEEVEKEQRRYEKKSSVGRRGSEVDRG